MPAESDDASDPTTDSTTNQSDSESASTVSDHLLDLQSADTDADQLTVERERSPLRGDLAAKSEQLTQWERRREQLSGRIDELNTSIEKAETEGAELTEHRQRLEMQMKTVIAPREAEALMHEIATIDGQRDDLDVAEMEALEEQSSVEDELVSHLDLAESVANAVQMAEAALAAAVVEIDAQLSALATRRIEVRAEIAEPLLTTYDHVRDALGVAVAKLQGKQCLGCHLDLSAAEVDTARDEAAETGITECPQCGRMLIA